MQINTTRKYLAKNEVYCFKPRRKPYLTATHKEKRRRFTGIHQFDMEEDVACIAFYDEARFEIGLDTYTNYVRRKKGKVYESRYLKPIFKSGRSSVHVFSVVSLDFKSELFIFDDKIRTNDKTYIKVLHDVGVPFYQQLAEKRGVAVWMQNGALFHVLS